MVRDSYDVFISYSRGRKARGGDDSPACHSLTAFIDGVTPRGPAASALEQAMNAAKAVTVLLGARPAARSSTSDSSRWSASARSDVPGRRWLPGATTDRPFTFSIC